MVWIKKTVELLYKSNYKATTTDEGSRFAVAKIERLENGETERRDFLRWKSVSIAKGVAETLFHDEMNFSNFLPNFGNPRIFFLIRQSMSILIKSTNTHRLIGFSILTI